MVDISQVIESPALAHPILVLSTDLQMSSAADDSFLELAHHLQRVAKVPACLCLPQSVTHSPSQSQVMLVVLHGLPK